MQQEQNNRYLPTLTIVKVYEYKFKEARKGFHCCSVCETMKHYKEGYLMVWTKYMHCPLGPSPKSAYGKV